MTDLKPRLCRAARAALTKSEFKIHRQKKGKKAKATHPSGFPTAPGQKASLAKWHGGRKGPGWHEWAASALGGEQKRAPGLGRDNREMHYCKCAREHLPARGTGRRMPANWAQAGSWEQKSLPYLFWCILKDKHLESVARGSRGEKAGNVTVLLGTSYAIRSHSHCSPIPGARQPLQHRQRCLVRSVPDFSLS